MARQSLPAHLRKTGPGTGGRNVARDAEIVALKATTKMSNDAIGEKYNMSRERVRQILNTAERDARAGRTRWMSAPERREPDCPDHRGNRIAIVTRLAGP
jgi:sigma-70-like protein